MNIDYYSLFLIQQLIYLLGGDMLLGWKSLGILCACVHMFKIKLWVRSHKSDIVLKEVYFIPSIKISAY